MWNTVKSFYGSPEWIVFREELILERGAARGVICELCNKHITQSKEIQLHHSPTELNELNVNDYNVSLNPGNIKILCLDCHNKEHGRFGHGNTYIARRHNGIYIVYGAPFSGKSSYVKQNMRRGDIVVDMDALYQAVTLLPLYDKPDNLKLNVFALRNCLIDNIKTRYGQFNSAWVIGGYPKHFDREKLKKDLGAELIFCDVTRDECLRRLENCRDNRRASKTEWREYIQKWFDAYSP